MLTCPPTWQFFVQPPGLLEQRGAGGRVTGYRINPARENRRYVQDEYYLDMRHGTTRAQIMERALNRPGTYRVGEPVWEQYSEETHLAPAPLAALPGHPILIGLDFGRTPCGVMAQNVFGRWRVLRELVTEAMGARAFARELKRCLAAWFPDNDFALWGDPTGDNFEQSDDISPFLMLRAEGLPVLKAPTNDPTIRINAVDELLRGMIDGAPRLVISPECRVLRAAMAGGYQYPRRRVAGSDQTLERPVKNRYSHIADALQYLVLGGGEGAALLGRVKPGAGRMTGQARPVTGARVRGVRR
jgi:hypothetical protein